MDASEDVVLKDQTQDKNVDKKDFADNNVDEKDTIDKNVDKKDIIDTIKNTTQDQSTTQTLSKRQQKKLLKRQRWLDTREERKKREREKQKLRLESKRAAGEACGNLRKRLKEVTMAASACKQRVAVDMSFDDLMIERHLVQCVKQISRCYSANRRVMDPMQLYVTSFEGKCKDLMSRQNGYMNWDVHFRTEKYTDIFPKEDVIYLTSESDNIITTLDDSKVYVIGGLVDHNLHKGLCYKLAIENGLQHAKLPLDDCVEMKTRKVLTVDQVFKIILGVSQRRTWKESCLDAIPPRKGAVGKDDVDENSDSSELKINSCASDDSQSQKSLESSSNGKITAELTSENTSS